jgi:dTDP-4-dehydrorhamnose 3,5-epimerase
MKFEETEIGGVWRISVQYHTDERGSFGRSFCRDEFLQHGLATEFLQMNISRTQKMGTIRGMHLQRPPHAEAKLIRCVRGAIHDVVCDLRPNSPTLMHHKIFRLDQDSTYQIYIPPGCAHGFQTLTDDVEVIYAMSANYAAASATGLRFDDPALGIPWPIAPTSISEKDLAWPPYRIEDFTELSSAASPELSRSFDIIGGV